MGVHTRFKDFAAGPSAEIAYAERLLNSIYDAEAGPVGQEILQELEASGCSVMIDQFPEGSPAAKDSASAAYVPFDDDDPDQIFVHQISLLPTSGQTSRLILSLAHEGGSHALAWNNSAALHASPYNTGNPAKPDFVLSPRDWIRAVILTEQDAYAKEKWIAALGAEHDPHLMDPEVQSIHTPQTFGQLRERTGNLHETLVTIANQSMTAPFTNESYRFGHFYVGNALATYNGCNRLNNNPEGLIPVRMDIEDMLSIGNSFGPNILGDERLFGRGDLSSFIFESGEQQIQKLNQKLGITNEAELPTLREALAARGMTPEQFLECSKQPLPKADGQRCEQDQYAQPNPEATFA